MSRPPVRGLRPTRIVLDNGVVVVAKETHKTPAVTMNLAVRSGSVCDPPGAAGAMNLVARVVDRGTESRSGELIADELDGRGVTLNIGVTRHLVSAVCTCLAADFERVLALIADVLQHPSFPEADIATRKGEVLTAIAQDEDNPYVRAADALIELLYGPAHPYSWPMKGTAASVSRLTRHELLQLHAERFAPGDLTAVIVGDVSPSDIEAAARRTLGSWSGPRAMPIDLPRPSPPASRQRRVIPMMNKAQADVAYGFVSIARSDPTFYAHWLMNNALGQYALGGRLGDSIRERQGMAYYVSSALEAQIIEGPLLIRAGVSPANVERAIASIDAELVRLREDGLTAKEFEESRQYLTGSMPRTLETNSGIANFLQRSEVFQLGLDFDVRIPELLAAVTIDDANAAARRSLDPDRATVVIAGPYSE